MGVVAHSEIAVMWDTVTQIWQVFNHIPGGGNILFLDGHVEFFKYPSTQFPYMPELCANR